MQHFTGSGRHNAALRELAVRQGLHVSEHGVLDDRDRAQRPMRPSGRCMSELGLSYIEPELREDRGELQAAAVERRRRRTAMNRSPSDRAAHPHLPKLIEQGDIRG